MNFICNNINTNDDGHLTFAGVDTVSLAKEYGTPLYILDTDRIREMCRLYISSLKKHFGENVLPLYASKALSFVGVYRILKEENMGIDVVSAGEIYTALKAGYPSDKMYFHGNYKTDDEIRFAIDNEVGCFIVDNLNELEVIDEYCARKGKKQKVMMRLSPGIDPHTFKAVVTGNVDSKFGVAIETGQAESATVEFLGKKNIDFCGYHCHIGSQIFDSIPFYDAAKIMTKFIADMKRKYGFITRELNLGGGIGVRYVDAHPELDIDAILGEIAGHVRNTCAEAGIAIPKILIEPGRSIVADAGMTLYTAGGLKEITGYKKYLPIDGGMSDNPRFALYQAEYTVYNASRIDESADTVCDVVGKCCESGDIIQENVKISSPQKGDVIAVCTTGAYNYSMASNYNKIPRPPIIGISNGKAEVLVKRESFSDLAINEL